MLELNHIHLKGGNKKLLEDECFQANTGQLTLICGESGCGKSTLLYEIGLLSEHEDIEYKIDDVDVRNLSINELLSLKRFEIGYVFQSNDLFENEDIYYNISHFASLVNKEIKEKDVLEYFQLLDLHIDMHQKVKSLSGGERQRIAIVCAMVKESHILVLDEITSALDSDNEERIFKILKDIAILKDIIVIMVSHSSNAKKYADKIYEIKDKHFICIKDNEKSGRLTLNLNRNLKLSLKQYYDYSKRYFRRYAFLNLLLVFALICGLSFLSFVDYYQQHYKDTVLNQVNDLSYNQLWVYDGKTTLTENTKLKKIIEECDIDIDIYPYFQGECYVNDEMIKIIPFYKDNKNNKLLSFESNYHTNIFVSEDIVSNKDDTLVINHKKTMINGIFKSGVRLYSSGYNFIAMNEQAATQYADYLEYNGYIVKAKNFNDLMKIERSLSQQPNLNVDSSMQDVVALEQYIISSERMMNYYGIGSICLISIIFTVFYILYYSSRKIEIVYLKVNGYTNQQLACILLFENIFRFLISIIPSSVITIYMKSVIYHMEINIPKMIINNILLSVLFIIIPYLFSCFYISILKPIKVYRK